MKLTKKLIGRCPVDSGQLMIVDPCYLSVWKDGDFLPNKKKPQNSYDAVCRITINNKNGRAGQTKENGVVFASGYGDGYYPVYGYYNAEGRILKVEIDMK